AGPAFLCLFRPAAHPAVVDAPSPVSLRLGVRQRRYHALALHRRENRRARTLWAQHRRARRAAGGDVDRTDLDRRPALRGRAPGVAHDRARTDLRVCHRVQEFLARHDRRRGRDLVSHPTARTADLPLGRGEHHRHARLSSLCLERRRLHEPRRTLAPCARPAAPRSRRMTGLVNDLIALMSALVVFNLCLTVSAIAIALPIACLFAVGRLSRHPLVYYPVTAYVNVLRSSPLLMIMFWAYYTGPMITGAPTSAYTAALIALAAFEVAYFTELVRAGLQSISSGQRDAALAVGLRPAQAMRLVLLPQALRRMLPSLISQSIIAFQDSTIASVIGVTDIFAMTNIISAREQRPIELYTALAVIFFILCYGLSKTVRALQARVNARTAGSTLSLRRSAPHRRAGDLPDLQVFARH